MIYQNRIQFLFSHIFQLKNKPTCIEIEFQIDTPGKYDEKLDFKYTLNLTRERILLEELKLKTSRLYSRVFKRKYDEKEKIYKPIFIFFKQ